MNIIQELTWRGLIKQITNEEKILTAQKENKGVYCGFDPTADSLHVGHLIPLVLLERFRQAGFQPIALIGGGTGMIGDPSFKSEERVLQTSEQVQKNSAALEKQIKNLIPKVQIMNNASWLNSISLIDFLRDVGKDFNLAYLIAKESIGKRIETGLSVTEFLYTTLQAYDFYQLHLRADCAVQVGGSDQWGNITSGTDYIASQLGKNQTNVSGLTIQLLTKKDGKKFGKSEGGAVWLDSQKTSEYEFYQFWVNQDDVDAELMLKFLTFLTQQEIADLKTKHQQAPHTRTLQLALAQEMTKFVHGEQGLAIAQALTEAFFHGQLLNLNADLLKLALRSLPTAKIEQTASVIEAIVTSGAASSKREAREFLTSKAISFNEQLVTNEHTLVSEISLINERYILVKRGKRKYFLLEVK